MIEIGGEAIYDKETNVPLLPRPDGTQDWFLLSGTLRTQYFYLAPTKSTVLILLVLAILY